MSCPATGRPPAVAGAREVEAETGLVVEDVETGWCGAVVRVEKAGGMRVVHLEDRRGRTQGVPDRARASCSTARPVVLTPPTAAAARRSPRPGAASRTASGSRAVAGPGPAVARGSRIFVEGRHDAELVEKVWGDDLRIEGVVVEMLDGVDDLAGAIRDFGPGPARRMGVLVDHLVPGTKESRLVDEAARAAAYARARQGPRPPVRRRVAVGAARAARACRRGRSIPRGQSWKHGICAAARLAAPTPGRHRPRVEADPRHRAHLRRPRAGAAGQRRGAHRLRHRSR